MDDGTALRAKVVLGICGVLLVCIFGLIIQSRISQALTAMTPTSTPAGTSLLLVQAGDLSSGLDTFTTAMPWRIYPGIPRSANVAYYEVYQGSDKRNEVGNISIIRYESAADIDRAHQAILTEMKVMGHPTDIEGLGERASSTEPTPDWDATDVLFVRCMTVVHITIPQSLETVVEYAQRLDQRIEYAGC